MKVRGEKGALFNYFGQYLSASLRLTKHISQWMSQEIQLNHSFKSKADTLQLNKHFISRVRLVLISESTSCFQRLELPFVTAPPCCSSFRWGKHLSARAGWPNIKTKQKSPEVSWTLPSHSQWETKEILLRQNSGYHLKEIKTPLPTPQGPPS